MRKIIRKILPAQVLAWHWKYIKSRRVKFEHKTHSQVFTEIFQNKYWGDEESLSGVGSTASETKNISAELPKLFREFNIQSMLDIPCGDFYWMRKVDLSGVQYTGADIVEALVEQNNAKYKRENVSFKHLDLVSSPLPKVDLIFTRDCLVHLSEDLVKGAIENIKKSGSKYLLTTIFTNTRQNENIVTGNWRPLNLCIAPFNFPPPIKTIRDTALQPTEPFGDKVMALWEIAKLP
jgi:hypothetical protein